MAQGAARAHENLAARVTESASKRWWTAIDRPVNSPAGRRVLLSIFLIVALVFSILPVLRCMRGQPTLDYRLWYEAGQRVAAGGDIYFAPKREFDFIYPPTGALFFGAASMLGQCGFITLLLAINSVAWLLSARFAARIAAGGENEPSAWLYLVPSFLVMASVWSNYHLGQPSIVLLALMLGAFVALRSKRETLAGSLIAVAAAIKAFPIAAIVYLAYRKYWKAVASMLVTLVFLLFLLPAPFRGGVQGSWHDFQKWSAGMFKYDARGVGQRPGRSQTWKNQSIVGVANRVLRPVDIDDTTPPDQPVYINFANLTFQMVNGIIVTISVLLGVVFVVAMPRREHRTARSDAIEFALLLLLMLMLTPLTYSYSFVWLMLPFAVITQRALAGNKRFVWWSIAGYAVLLLATPNPRIAQAYGSFFFGSLILFIGLSIELLREKRAH